MVAAATFLPATAALAAEPLQALPPATIDDITRFFQQYRPGRCVAARRRSSSLGGAVLGAVRAVGD
jgi:hypothetical protein